MFKKKIVLHKNHTIAFILIGNEIEQMQMSDQELLKFKYNVANLT